MLNKERKIRQTKYFFFPSRSKTYWNCQKTGAVSSVPDTSTPVVTEGQPNENMA